MLDYLGAINSDLSRFHQIRQPETLSGPEYFALVEYLGAYEGAVSAIHRMREEEAKKKRPVPPGVKKANAGQVQEVSAEQALAMVSDGKEF